MTVEEAAEKTKTWEAVYRDLQRGIISGAYWPRERLIEDEIMARTKATRHAVRRAFDELERAGLVVRQPNRGVQVRDYSIEEIEELYEIRECLEMRAATHFSAPAAPDLVARLTDIATVIDDAAEQRSASQLNGAQVITFDFQRAKSASDIAVFHGAEKKLAELEKRNPDVKFKLIFNNVQYAEMQYESAIEAMLEGAALAVVVVFLFLRDWRATAISAATCETRHSLAKSPASPSDTSIAAEACVRTASASALRG